MVRFLINTSAKFFLAPQTLSKFPTAPLHSPAPAHSAIIQFLLLKNVTFIPLSNCQESLRWSKSREAAHSLVQFDLLFSLNPLTHRSFPRPEIWMLPTLSWWERERGAGCGPWRRGDCVVTPAFREMSPGNMSDVLPPPPVCHIQLMLRLSPPSPRLSSHYNVRCKIVSKYQLVISTSRAGDKQFGANITTYQVNSFRADNSAVTPQTTPIMLLEHRSPEVK